MGQELHLRLGSVKYYVSMFSHILAPHPQGFSFTFQHEGGMVPPLRGGTRGGGFGQIGGGMPRDSFATMGLNIIVYFMVTFRQLLYLKTSYNIALGEPSLKKNGKISEKFPIRLDPPPLG